MPKSVRNKKASVDQDVEKSNSMIISAESIESSIFLLRGQKVMLDADLAPLYEESIKRLKQQVNRNISRFPKDFMFQLTWEELDCLRLHFATLKKFDHKHDPNSMRGRHIKYLPYAFTGQGIAMLSSVLTSKRAIQVNIAIMRAFVKIRQLLTFNKELIQKLSEIEHKIGRHDQDIISLFSAINKILKDESKPKGKFGFV
ncbi:MAG: ORF6N domain-containing protein [Candidatus Saganbacteria bacterium]|nr:ORF6N domain-containing protein [Candidatus Saganbacteria bacterium]